VSRGFLLDTHALLWWLFEAERLSYHSMDVISDGSIDVYVSAVSAMEIATKHRRGQLPPAHRIIGRFVEAMEEEGFKQLSITQAHAELAGSFSSPHNDPWDRLLAAQAQLEQLTLVSSDREIGTFGIKTYW
jgi:PIN domain nuclease of toxin-antitoxin system